MCGIIGIFDNDEAVKLVEKGLQIIHNRGKDASNIFFEKEKRNAIGHVLHSVVNTVEQPIQGNKGILAANCEIYNWKELNKKYKLNAKNDSEVILKLIEKKGVINLKKILIELDGVFAFVYTEGTKVYLVRDLLGVKPLWYTQDSGFAFCSEKKALERQSFTDIEELNPRKILIYDGETGNVSFKERTFFKITPEIKEKYALIKKKVSGLVTNAVAKRIPDKKFGILFSGGIDSTLIALICKQLGVDFTCYTAALDEPTMSTASDLIYAKKIAKELGFKLKVKKLRLKDVEKYIKKVAPLIEDNTVVKVGVGLTFYVACELAKKDKIKVIFSGLGAEELFAGYERHKYSSNVNNECISGLLKLYERDLYRDDVITMNNNLELRLPFLDKELAKYSLKISAKHKMNKEENKLILREVAQDSGLKKEYSFRKKVGAQYGSKFAKAIEKLTKKSKFSSKAEYLAQFYTKPNVKIAALVSSGKDSIFSTYLMKVHNYDVKCFVSLKSKNKESYMFHTPAIDMIKLQSKSSDIPLIYKETKGKKEDELKDMKKALKLAKEKYGVEGVVTGALFSNYQRERVEKVCDSLGLKIFAPLWHMDQELLMRHLLKNNFKFIFTAIAAEGLDKTWLNKLVTAKEINKLKILNKKYGLNIAGEGGETESLVLDCPLFNQKIDITDSKIEEDSENCARLIVKKAKLVDK